MTAKIPRIRNEILQEDSRNSQPLFRRELKWYDHILRSNNLSTVTLKDTIIGRKEGADGKKWSDNVFEWTGRRRDTGTQPKKGK